jgi:hypothetical protein
MGQSFECVFAMTLAVVLLVSATNTSAQGGASAPRVPWRCRA